MLSLISGGALNNETSRALVTVKSRPYISGLARDVIPHLQSTIIDSARIICGNLGKSVKGSDVIVPPDAELRWFTRKDLQEFFSYYWTNWSVFKVNHPLSLLHSKAHLDNGQIDTCPFQLYVFFFFCRSTSAIRGVIFTIFLAKKKGLHPKQKGDEKYVSGILRFSAAPLTKHALWLRNDALDIFRLVAATRGKWQHFGDKSLSSFQKALDVSLIIYKTIYSTLVQL